MAKKNRQNLLLLMTSGLLNALDELPTFAAPGYKGPETDHFDGDKFHNRINSAVNLIDFFKFSLPYPFVKARWPEQIKAAPRQIPYERRTGDIGSVTFINHSTVLIQADGINILTDPIFSLRASSFSHLGPKRVRNPGVNLSDLPPIDVILVSHNHYDHLDIASLQLLSNRPGQDKPPRILSGLGNGRLFHENGLTRFTDLDWNQSAHFKNIEFIFTESRHRSGRGISDQNKTLWGGFIIKTRLGNIYFAGDTGYGPHFKDARNAHGDFVLALLPIGAYEPRWFMKVAHLNPDDAAAAHRDLNAKKSMAIHFGTFQLTYESINQPLIDLKKALADRHVPATDFITPAFGQTYEFTP